MGSFISKLKRVLSGVFQHCMGGEAVWTPSHGPSQGSVKQDEAVVFLGGGWWSGNCCHGCLLFLKKTKSNNIFEVLKMNLVTMNNKCWLLKK